MKNEAKNPCAALLCVCYLAQLTVGAAQPFALPTQLTIPLLAAATLLQSVLYHSLRDSGAFSAAVFPAAAAVFFCFAAGFDVVRAERFYRAVTSERFSFWWLTVSLLLIGWYAAHCGRDTLLRAAQPVLAALLLSLAVLAVMGSYRPERLVFAEWEPSLLRSAGRVFLEYTFSAEVLLWLFWKTADETPAQREAAAEKAGGSLQPVRNDAGCGPQIALWLRFGIAVAFVLLGELALGRRAPGEAQLFGVLSLISAGADAGRGGVVYHCIWLTALALRVCALCSVLHEWGKSRFPQLKSAARFAAETLPVAATAVFWAIVWRQSCQVWLAAAALVLTVGCLFIRKREAGEHAKKAYR